MKFHNLKIKQDKRLREQAKGIYEGKPRKISQEKLDKEKIKWHEFIPEKGESYPETQKRVVEFFNEIKNKHKNKNILIISHGGPITLLLCHLLNEPLKNHRKFSHKENTSFSIIETGNKINLIKLASTEHLN